MFFWPGMNSTVLKSVLWFTCATVQGQERKQNSALHGIEVGKPFACVGMDLKKWRQESLCVSASELLN